jgi:hypothetical protein
MATVLKRLTPNADFLIPGEFEETENINQYGSIEFGAMTVGSPPETNYSIQKYGGALEVDGGPVSTNPLNIGTSNFTMEFWIKQQSQFGGEYYSSSYRSYFSNPTQTIFSSEQIVSNLEPYAFDVYIFYDAGTGLQHITIVHGQVDGNHINRQWRTGALPLNKWGHLAIVRTNTDLRLYKNGIDQGSPYFEYGITSSDVKFDGKIFISGSPFNSYALTPRGHTSNFVCGNLTGIHWTKEAKYTSNFTPSYPVATANTILLLNCVDSDNALKDSSNNNISVTANTIVGNVSFSGDDPYIRVSSRATENIFYSTGFDEVTIHPMTNGLAMRETSNTIMIAGEFDEVTKI